MHKSRENNNGKVMKKSFLKFLPSKPAVNFNEKFAMMSIRFNKKISIISTCKPIIFVDAIQSFNKCQKMI